MLKKKKMNTAFRILPKFAGRIGCTQFPRRAVSVRLSDPNTIQHDKMR